MILIINTLLKKINHAIFISVKRLGAPLTQAFGALMPKCQGRLLMRFVQQSLYIDNNDTIMSVTLIVQTHRMKGC